MFFDALGESYFLALGSLLLWKKDYFVVPMNGDPSQSQQIKLKNEKKIS